jgi:hypothetical protein
MNSQRSQGQAVSPASSGLSYPDCPIASRSGAGTYLIATYGAGAKARPSTRWGWTIKSAKTCLALRSGWYGCYQHRRDRMRLSSPSNVIRSCHGRRHRPPAAARLSHRLVLPARGAARGTWSKKFSGSSAVSSRNGLQPNHATRVPSAQTFGVPRSPQPRPDRGVPVGTGEIATAYYREFFF